MQKTIGLILVLVGMSAAAFAGIGAAPEIDPATGVSALVVLSGAVLIIRARRRK